MYRRHFLQTPSISPRTCSILAKAHPRASTSLPQPSRVPPPSSQRSFHVTAPSLARARPPWEVLGVPPNADEATIKKAWRLKAKEFHPDLNKTDKRAHDRFVEAKLAYEAMLNPEKRVQWDMEERAEAQTSRRNAKRSAPHQPGRDASEDEMRQFWRDFEKIFQDMDHSKRNKGYQRVRVEMKRPFRGSTFTWTYEGPTSSQQKKGSRKQNQQQKQQQQEEDEQEAADFFSSVFSSFFTDSLPRAEWREYDFLPSKFIVKEAGKREWEVMGDTLSFGNVRIHPQNENLLEYTVNGKIVARATMERGEVPATQIKFEKLSLYDWRGVLLGSIMGPASSPWFHLARSYEAVDAQGRLLFTIDKSLVVFNKLVWFDPFSRPIAGATRSRISSRAPFQFSFAYQSEELHPAFFILPLIAWKEDRLTSKEQTISQALAADWKKFTEWLSSKR